jgi:HAD superfamily hydrolase (TIGR01549 family)
MLKTILFDLDGTLIDTESIILESLQVTLQDELNLFVNNNELTFVLGIPGKEALKKFVTTEDEIESLHSKWSARLNEVSHHAPLFAQTKEVLDHLKTQEYNLGVVTSKLSEETTNELIRLDLNEYFNVVVTPEDTKKHKPNPDPLLKALEHFNARPEETIYIGDSVYDFRSAQSSNIHFALALWGAQEHKEFDKVKLKFEEPKDLLVFLDDN